MEYFVRFMVLFLIAIPIFLISEIFAIKKNKVRSAIYGLVVGSVVALLIQEGKTDIIASILVEYSFLIFIAEVSLVVYYLYRKDKTKQSIFFLVLSAFAITAGIFSLSRITAAGWLFVLGIFFIVESIILSKTA